MALRLLCTLPDSPAWVLAGGSRLLCGACSLCAVFALHDMRLGSDSRAFAASRGHQPLDLVQAQVRGLLLRGVERTSIERGQVIAKPGSIKPHRKFRAEVYVLSKDEGGRHKPFVTGYRPQFFFRTTDVTGTLALPAGVEMVMPGDNITMDIELIEGKPVAMEQGSKFAIREGGKTVGAGTITEITE